MNSRQEITLANLPGSTGDNRVLLVLLNENDGSTHVELRQQSWSDSAGWFTQSTVKLDPEQVGDLRNAIGSTVAQVKSNSLMPAKQPVRSFQPRIVHADSA